MPDEIQEDIEEIRKEFLEKVPNVDESERLIKAQESDYPPCVTYLLKQSIKRGASVTH